jgi:hypothetical protein
MTPLPPGLTHVKVQWSIDAALKALSPAAKEIGQILSHAEKLPMSSSPAREKYRRLSILVERAGELVGPVTACTKGCGHCCKMAVGITQHDAEVIRDGTGVEFRPVQTDLTTSPSSMVETYMGVPCPFLKKGSCEIYEFRPIACRTHFNLSGFPDLCDVVTYPGNDVPNINFSAIWTAVAMISFNAGDSCGDIREYFPDGLRTAQCL